MYFFVIAAYIWFARNGKGSLFPFLSSLKCAQNGMGQVSTIYFVLVTIWNDKNRDALYILEDGSKDVRMIFKIHVNPFDLLIYTILSPPPLNLIEIQWNLWYMIASQNKNMICRQDQYWKIAKHIIRSKKCSVQLKKKVYFA